MAVAIGMEAQPRILSQRAQLSGFPYLGDYIEPVSIYPCRILPEFYRGTCSSRDMAIDEC